MYMFKSNDNIFVSYLRLINVKYTRYNANKLYYEHPYRNSMYGLSNMLLEYGIKNFGIVIRDKLKGISSIETPFIAFFGNRFVIVTDITQGKVGYLWDGKMVRINISSFNDYWTGNVLLTEETKESIEPNYKKNRNVELFNILKYGVLMAIISIYAGVSIFNNIAYYHLYSIVLLLINIIGAFFGYLLIIKEHKINSHYADKICSSFLKGDCNSVLESKASSLFGIIKWSEVGFSYFISNVIMLIVNIKYIQLLAFLNILTLPFSFWSIWYQKFKVNQICPICIIVQILLWTIFLTNLFSGVLTNVDMNYYNIPNAIFVYIISYLVISCNQYREMQ